MSVRDVIAVLSLHEADLTPSEVLLLLALANYADDDGRCWPSQRRLAEDTHMAERSVRYGIESLIQKGFVSKAHRRRPDGSRATNMLMVSIPKPPATVAGGGGLNHRQLLPPPPATVATLTSFEPVNESKTRACARAEGARPPLGSGSPPRRVDTTLKLREQQPRRSDMPNLPVTVPSALYVAVARAEGEIFADSYLSGAQVVGAELHPKTHTAWSRLKESYPVKEVLAAQGLTMAEPSRERPLKRPGPQLIAGTALVVVPQAGP